MAVLTKKEAAWVKKLQKLLDECPSDRMGGFTTGDPTITLYDQSLSAEIDKHYEASDSIEFFDAVDAADAKLAVIKFPFQIHSTAG